MEKPTASSPNKTGILAKNTLINVVGRGIPLLFAVVAIPFVIDGLGTERFGILTIVWILIGYFGLFDMGIGRATTKFVADQQAQDAGKLPPLVFTSLLLLMLFGIIGGSLIALLTPYIVGPILNIPSDLTAETRKAFYILSASIPLVLGSVGARGVLEAQQRFAMVNVIKIPASIINYVGPLLILPFSNQLHHVVIVLVVGRGVSFIIYLYFSCRDLNFAGITNYPFFAWSKKLLGFGAWLTVSNLISPIMMYMDRFILGAILTMTAVAYYTTPYEIVTRLGIISGGFMGVMFPAFSVYSMQSRDKLAALHQKSIRYLMLVFLPVIAFLIFSAQPLLYYWLGAEFAKNSALVLQILAGGILINTVARVPSTLIQAAGRPDINAKLHLVELPFYLLLLWFLAQSMGIVGVAIAWVLRVALDGGFLLYFSNRMINFMQRDWAKLYRPLILYLLVAGVLGSVFYFINNNLGMMAFGLGAAVLVLYINWTYLLTTADRTQIFETCNQIKEAFTTGSVGFW